MVKCIEEYVQVDDFKMYSKSISRKEVVACFSEFNWERTIDLENGLHCKCKPFSIYKKIS